MNGDHYLKTLHEIELIDNDVKHEHECYIARKMLDNPEELKLVIRNINNEFLASKNQD